MTYVLALQGTRRVRLDGYREIPLDGAAALDNAVPALAGDFAARFGLDGQARGRRR